jgi:2-dehydro-3-deoxy-D-arabinonate dehydratase
MHKLCRFQKDGGRVQVGVITELGSVCELGFAGISTLTEILEASDPAARVEELLQDDDLPTHSLADITLLAPIEGQEVWAAGVTYLRSKTARMGESDFSANAYDRVYAADRPEIFLKSLPEKVVGPGDEVGIREDAKWNVPEPELALVINSRKKVVGYTIGNDMSSRDIEGENLLYLPQAKVYDKSCAMGPCIVIGPSEAEVRAWTIGVKIFRDGAAVFEGETTIDQIKRSFDELAGYLCRSQSFPMGAALLTGTGVVPGDDFTLAVGDVVTIDISGVGTLENTVAVV